MAAQTRVVKLIENYIYPTFQLYAVMANRKISPKEGLRLAALTVMEWLRQRMGERIPPELEQPAPDQYKTAGDQCLPSLHLNRGYLIDILSLPEQGIWSLQITEPDLGSEPGNKDQLRAPVAGRVIETNIGFHIRDKVLECGFQTLISDPEGTREKADVYRLAIVRRLMENPEFGLKQILPLSGAVPRLRTASELSKAAELSLAPENQLPVVIFTCRPSKIAKADDAFQHFAAPKVLNWDKVELNLDDFAAVPAFARDLQPELPEPPVLEETPPYDVSEVAEKLKGFCRVYLAETALLAPLSELAGKKVCPGDIVALEPACFGAKRTVFAYPGRRTEQQSRLDELLRWGYIYPREKPCDFGEVRFLSAAREYPLDWHLGVGSDPENLLRIYFFHDDTARKIVIGSMPEHLTAVQIQ